MLAVSWFAVPKFGGRVLFPATGRDFQLVIRERELVTLNEKPLTGTQEHNEITEKALEH
jgi:hypothetical protein